MTREQWILKNATALSLALGVNPLKAKVYLEGVVRSSSVFRFDQKFYPTEAQIDYVANVVDKAGDLFKNDVIRKIRIPTPDGDQDFAMVPLSIINDLAEALKGQKEKEYVEEHQKKSKLILIP